MRIQGPFLVVLASDEASQGALVVKNPPTKTGEQGLTPGLGRSRGGGHSSPLQYSYLGNPHGQRSLVGYRLWGCRESDMTEAT